jgi:protocatechuate 3,4-dioxygenase beta subunit
VNRTLLILLLVLVLGGVVGLWIVRDGQESAVADSSAAPEASREVAVVAPSDAPRAPSSVEATTRVAPERVVVETAPAVAPRGAPRGDATGTLVRGVAVDESGAPLANVAVSVSPGDMGFAVDLFGGDEGDEERGGRSLRAKATTSSDGRFELRVRKSGDTRFSLRLAGHAPLDETRPIPTGDTFEAGTFTLIPGPIVTGRVVDSRGAGVAKAKLGQVRNELPGGLVFLGGSDGARPLGETRDDGSFVLDILPAGELELRVDSEAHPVLKQRLEGSLKSGERRDGVVLRLDEGASISGVAVGVPEGTLEVLRVLATPSRSSKGGMMVVGVDGEDMFAGASGEWRGAKLASDGSFLVDGLRPQKAYDLSLRLREGDAPLNFSPRMSPKVAARAGDRGVSLDYQPDSSLRFTVVDARTKAPVERYRVYGGLGKDAMRMPYIESGERETEHPAGIGKLGNLRRRGDSDTVNLWISAVGYREWSRRELPLGPTSETEFGVIELEPAPILAVTVLDASGAPLAGARVTLRRTREGERDENGLVVRSFRMEIGAAGDESGDLDLEEERSVTARTDEKGLAQLTQFEGARCELSVSHPEHAPYRSESFVSASGTSVEREVRMSKGGSVRVSLLDAAGQPLAGGKIEHRAGRGAAEFAAFSGGGSEREVTDTAGVALFRFLTPGTHRFRPESGGDGAFASGGVQFVIAGMDDEAAESQWVEVEVIDGNEVPLTLRAPLQLALRGTISEGREALSGASVSLVPKREGEAGARRMFFGDAGPRARTDGRGRYEIKNVKPGTYTVKVSHKSRTMPAESEVTLGDRDATLDLVLDIAILEGKVTGPDGRPLAGAKVRVERAGGGSSVGVVRMVMMSAGGDDESSSVVMGGDETSAVTDVEGRYVLRGVQPNVALIVRAESKGYREAKSEELVVGPNEVRSRVDLQLAQAGQVEVTVRSGGEPLEQGLVTAYREGGRPDGDAKREVIQGGRALLRDLEPGRWVVSARPFEPRGGGRGSESERSETVVVEAGKTASVALDL